MAWPREVAIHPCIKSLSLRFSFYKEETFFSYLFSKISKWCYLKEGWRTSWTLAWPPGFSSLLMTCLYSPLVLRLQVTLMPQPHHHGVWRAHVLSLCVGLCLQINPFPPHPFELQRLVKYTLHVVLEVVVTLSQSTLSFWRASCQRPPTPPHDCLGW